jgi:hypothetical protein
MDKYQLLRDSLPELMADASRQGVVRRRAQLVIDLLEERDQLVAALRIAAEQPKAFKELPMCSSMLSQEERIRLDEHLKSLLGFLGSPGDWGYETQLGRLAVVLAELRRDIWTTAVAEG